MYYAVPLVIPASTPRTARASATAELHPGTLVQVEIVFPQGCAGLVHVQINYNVQQIFPTNPGGYFTGDGETITFREDIELGNGAHLFTVYGWNDDDTFEHIPIVRFGVLPVDADRDIAALLSSLMPGYRA